MTLDASRARAGEALRDALSDTEAAVRAEAALALGERAAFDLDSQAALLVAAEDPDARVRCAVCLALASFASVSVARDALLRRVRDDEPNVRRAALRSLGSSGGALSREAVFDALETEPELWEEAAAAVAAAADRSVIERLVTVLCEGTHAESRRGAARAIAALDRRRGDPVGVLGSYVDEQGVVHPLM